MKQVPVILAYIIGDILAHNIRYMLAYSTIRHFYVRIHGEGTMSAPICRAKNYWRYISVYLTNDVKTSNLN